MPFLKGFNDKKVLINTDVHVKLKDHLKPGGLQYQVFS